MNTLDVNPYIALLEEMPDPPAECMLPTDVVYIDEDFDRLMDEPGEISEAAAEALVAELRRCYQ